MTLNSVKVVNKENKEHYDYPVGSTVVQKPICELNSVLLPTKDSFILLSLLIFHNKYTILFFPYKNSPGQKS